MDPTISAIRPTIRRAPSTSTRSPTPATDRLNFKFDAGDTSIDGIVGLRAVRTKETINGFSVTNGVCDPGPPWTTATTTGCPTRTSTCASRRNGSFASRRRKPARGRLSSSSIRASISPQPDTNCDPTHTNCERTGSGGNPFLKPLKSTNFDASLEYYFSQTGFASVGVFRRDMKGFIPQSHLPISRPRPVDRLPAVDHGPGQYAQSADQWRRSAGADLLRLRADLSERIRELRRTSPTSTPSPIIPCSALPTRPAAPPRPAGQARPCAG